MSTTWVASVASLSIRLTAPLSPLLRTGVASRYAMGNMSDSMTHTRGRRVPPAIEEANVTGSAFTSDGRWLAATTTRWKPHLETAVTASVWDATNGHGLVPDLLVGDQEEPVKLSQDGRWLVATHPLRLWDLGVDMTASPDQVMLEAEIETGLRVNEDGSLVPMSLAEWMAARQGLHRP